MKGKGCKTRALETENCGVWLDTAQLRRKPKQAVLSQSALVRFNPISRKTAFESTTIDFTQTKTPNLCTKQTSMYSFFTKVGSILFTKEMYSIDTMENQRSSDSFNRSTEKRYCPKTVEHTNDGTILDNSYSFKTDKLSHNCLYKGEDFAENSLPYSREVGINHKNRKTSGPDLSLRFLCSNEEANKEDHVCQSSQLFTQDTQGNKVIAHWNESDQQKNRHIAIPLRDMTNTNWDMTYTLDGSMSSSYIDSAQNMFTQDSEGNVVIKH
ncbi:hypothetical protein GDO86_003506 [Hymenochirus boettgeri]|uniref:Uncharacterized protein n=1 Tax=Hymenochirus boettgeri TaxID=247094 RepID=A0A8T2K656_9PIPI|nr:hypothetical protein GDO86_003506 [Hymenochirus boettgeri]